jgi:hypothetical protein
MIKKTRSQAGSVHIVIAIIVVVAIISALGYVVWNNFVKSNNINSNVNVPASHNETEVLKKSEIVSLENNDSNKYINYERGFEFNFPKKILTTSKCRELNTRRDNYGNEYPSERHYGGSTGVEDMIVIESGDSYTIAPKHVVVQSSPIGSAEAGYLYTSCEVKLTNADIIHSTKTYDYKKNISLEQQSFNVYDVESEKKALDIIKDLFQDPEANVRWVDDFSNNRNVGEYLHSSSQAGGGFAYKLWYYPTQKKLVFIVLGHSYSFAYPSNLGTNSDKYYYPELVDTFTLTSK